MPAPHRAQLLALVQDQAPDRLTELTAFLDDPVLFAATALSLVADGLIETPAPLQRMLNADLADGAGFETDSPPDLVT